MAGKWWGRQNRKGEEKGGPCLHQKDGCRFGGGGGGGETVCGKKPPPKKDLEEDKEDRGEIRLLLGDRGNDTPKTGAPAWENRGKARWPPRTLLPHG